jgi:outer membrane protein assembly factor BamB
VLGHRKRRHFQACGLIEQLIDATRTVEQGKLSVTMEVYEVLISHWRSLRNFTRYYSGVPFRRTTISCVALAFFTAIVAARSATAAVTFPLEPKWSATLPASPEFAPAFDATRIYVALRSKQLVALLIADGTVSWSVECPMTAAPAAGAGLVYVGNDNLIEARSETDGKTQWRRPLDGKVVGLYWDAGWLFAQTEPGLFLAIRATDGAIVWQKDFGSPINAPARPAAAGQRLYLPLNDGRVVALALETGDEVWNKKLTEPATGILPVGDRVFVGSRDNRLHSLEAEDGDADWRWPTGADLLGVPVLDAKRVYFIALDNSLYANRRNSGSMDWRQVLPFRPFTGPLLSGETLVVAGVAAQLRAYNAIDGKPSGTFELKGAENEEMLLAAPAHLTANDTFILVTRGGQVRAVGSSTAPAAPAETEPADNPADSPSPAAADEAPAGATSVP